MIPRPPKSSDIDRCGSCKFWLRDHSQEVVQTPQGLAPAAMARQQNSGILPPGIKAVNAAACTYSPSWIMQPSNAWCWQYAKASAVVE
jgi:hypothetical protein